MAPMNNHFDKNTIIKKRIDYFAKAAIVVVVLSALPDLYYQMWESVLIAFLVIIIFSVCIYFNKRQSGYFWGSVLSLCGNGFIFYTSVSFGDASRASLFYLPLFVATFLVADYAKKRDLFFNISHIVIAFFALEIIGENVILNNSLNPEAIEWFGRINTVLAMLTSIYFLVVFVNEITNREQSLIITKHKLEEQNEALKQKNNELDRLIYSISHDIKSPLASIEGLVNLAALENQQQALIPYLTRIETSVERLKKFLHEVIEYFKANRFELVPAEIDFAQEIKYILESLENLPNYKEITVSCHIKQKVKFISDKMRIQTILVNLISNALKYQKPHEADKKVEITVTVWDFKVRIEVFDNGIGVDQNIQNKVFDMFYRGAVQSEGSGLGLYIMSETVKQLHGFVKLESVPDLYSRFIVEIPAMPADKKDR